MKPDELLVGLDEAQRAAVTSNATPLCIFAGAGSGKTRVLTHRIAYRAATNQLDPSRTLAITFTRKAAGELVERLSKLGMPRSLSAGTFHSVAFAQLRTYWADQGVRAPTLLDKPASFVMRLLPNSRTADFSEALDTLAEIDWAGARMLGPDEYAASAAAARRTPSRGIASVAEVFERYEEEKRNRGVIDMTDLLNRYRSAMTDDKSFMASQQWRFRHLFVDEFQDVNPAQNALLEAILGSRTDLCIVGDPNQAIYSFNGAEQSLLINFASRLGPSGTIRLDQNYRSTPQIVAVGQAVLGRSAGGSVHPTRESGDIPTITSHATDKLEANAIARSLRDRHHKGNRWSEQAVLVRTNAQVAAISEALTSSDIPHRMRGTDNRGATGTGGASAPDGSGPTEAVEVSTFHAAKGLEWKVVHLAGMERGLMPIGHARTPAQEAEEQRLLHVAITRAQRELHITWAHERSFGARTSKRTPSEYLGLIEEALAALERGEDPLSTSTARAGLRPKPTTRPVPPQSRRHPPVGVKPEVALSSQKLFQALRTWRSTKARAANVPAYVIFHDSTLEAVASATPRSMSDLMSVPGIGPVKAGRYGDDILKLVDEHI